MSCLMSSDGSIGCLRSTPSRCVEVFARVAVLVELDAGHEHQVVLGPGALFLALDLLEIGLDFARRNDQAGQVHQLAEQPLRIAQVVGDAEAIEAALAVEIDDLRHGQLAVGPGRVRVQIAKEQLLRQMPELDRLSRFSRELDSGAGKARNFGTGTDGAAACSRMNRARFSALSGRPSGSRFFRQSESSRPSSRKARSSQSITSFGFSAEHARIGLAQERKIPLFLARAESCARSWDSARQSPPARCPPPPG